MSSGSFPLAVVKDAAYSNLYGVRVNGLETVADREVNVSLTIGSADIKNVTATSINGSAANIALTNCNPNELLATDAQTRFVSIPYVTDATANSVPKRTASDFTSFAQLFLTDTSNQITANLAPNQTIISAVAPADPRTYSLHFEGTDGVSMLVVSSASDGVLAFLDPAVTVTQIGLKSTSGGSARLMINSFTANDANIAYYFGGTPSWTLGNRSSDNHFIFNHDEAAVTYVDVFDDTTVTGDVVPLTSGLALGSTAKRWCGIGLNTGANTTTDSVTFTGTNITPGNFQTINVLNSTVTTGSVIVCQIYDFSGFYFTNGCPYAMVTNVANGSFDLNVVNVDATTTIGNTRTTIVRYWVLS